MMLDCLRCKAIFVILLMLFTTTVSKANDTVVPADSINTENHNIIQRIIRYFDDTNKPHEEKVIDYSVIGGPSYSNDTKLSLGIIGAAAYKSVRFDSLTPLSNASVYSIFSITGFYLIGVRGNHIGPKDNYRISYKVSFSSMPTYFWGIGYKEGRNNDNKTKYLELHAKIEAAYVHRLASNLYLGPALDFYYYKATRNNDWRLWNGQSPKTFNYGVGIKLDYDTRDNLTAPKRGWYIGLDQRFYPRFIGNDYAFSSTDFTINKYFGAWKDAIIAAQVHSKLTYGNTPWGMMAKLGGSDSMRGYYEGRYRDKCGIDCTLEVRQHIWRRNSIVVWAGAGTVFPKFSDLHTNEILPNFGLGYRWEFKKNVNVRVDIGFGKGENGFVFNINEAF